MLNTLIQGHLFPLNVTPLFYTTFVSYVIAHRLSTIKHADQILVLKDGEIIERGKFNELLDAQGFFYDLYMSQFRRQEPVGGNGHKDTGNGQKAEGGMRAATAAA